MFKFELIPSDIKWMSSHSRELNNCTTYFSPFANVNQTNKGTLGGFIGCPKAAWLQCCFRATNKTTTKQHGNHGSTPRDWPLQRKWKSRRKDLKIPRANKKVILPNLLFKTSRDKNFFLCWGSMLIYSRRNLYITLLCFSLNHQRETLRSLPHLTFQALKNRKQRGTFWKIRDCCCFLEMSLVCVLHYNRECS